MQPRGFSKCKGEYMPIIQKNNEIQQEVEKLKKENARLKAALSIQVLQSLKGEIEELVDNLKNTKQ